MDLPIIASLWIGGSLSYIEQVCLKSFVDHGHRVILYTYGEVENIPPGVEVMDANQIFPNTNYIRHARTGSPAVHADAFRYQMLEVQNVIWADADMLCVRPWDFKDQWVFGWEDEGRQVCNAVMGLPRFSKTLAKLNALCRDEYPVPPWAPDEARAELQARKDAGNPVHVSEMEWGVWGPSALTHFLNQTSEMQYVMPQAAFYPIPFKRRRQLLSPGLHIDNELTDATYGVHLWNRRLRRWLIAYADGVADPQSYLGRALARHGIDPKDAPIPDEPPGEIAMDDTADTAQAETPAAAVAPEVAARPEPAPEAKPAPVPQTAKTSSPAAQKRDFQNKSGIRRAMLKPADSAEPMQRRPIDPNLPTVAGLWIGGTLSYLEQVCLLSFRDFGHRTILYTYHGVDKVPDGIEVLDANEVMPAENYITHKNSDSPALHSDVFRYYMIQQTGYVWIDADVLCVQPWTLDSKHIFGWEKPPNLICGAVLGLPQDSQGLSDLIEFCKDEFPIPPWAEGDERAEIEAAHAAGKPIHVTELTWGVWGPAALTHFLIQTGEVEQTLSQEAFYPVSFKDRLDFLEPERDLSDKVDEGCLGVHLWNRRIRRRLVTHEVNLPHPDCLVGRALLRHRVDPLLAPIPDTPPPGSPKQAEVLGNVRPMRLEKFKNRYIERAGVYAAIENKANANVAGELIVEPGSLVDRFNLGKLAQDSLVRAGITPPQPAAPTPTEAAPQPQHAANPAPDEDDDEDLGEGTSSINPNVTHLRPAAMDALPVMEITQDPHYQSAIDALEGRTAGITGYLKDPEQPIDNSKILVVTSMKNEAPFILEWVAYHKAIGVDHFLVYTNDCTDNTNDMLDRLSALGHVTRVPNPWVKESGKKPQHVALKDALKQPCYHEANWVLTIDCDEFVNIHVGDGTFPDLFKAMNYPNVVSFTWKFFGNRGVHGYEDRPIMEQFTACAPEFIPKPRLGWGFKSMFHKSSPYTRIGVHRPLGIDDGEEDEVRWVNGSGRAMPDMLLTNNGWRSTKRSLGYRLATLNHYILRSAESFLVKRDRGRINHTEHDQGIDYWMRRNYTSETDDRIHARLPMMKKVLEEFLADPQLCAMHEEAVGWHRGKIQALLQKPDYKQLFDDLTTVKRPDALEVAKQAETENDKQIAEASAAFEAEKPKLTYVMPQRLRQLRVAKPPESAAKSPRHERFTEAGNFARRTHGFLWEGEHNAMLFVPKSKRLVVSFDNLSISRAEGQRWPWGMKALYQDLGCSVLGVMAVNRNWFREDFTHDAFEALRDQGFFEQFDDITFYGASMGGFGALVYQSCAPGSRVLTIAPQSTLDRDILPNEDRWGWTKNLDWKGRFADAAPLTHLASDIKIIADPYYAPDRAQIDRLQGENVTVLKTPFMGHQLPNAFHVMNILRDILVTGVSGTLTSELFYKLFRARRDLPRYQHDLLMHAEARGKIKSAIRVCEYTLKKRKAGNMRRTMEKLKAQLAEQEQKAAAE